MDDVIVPAVFLEVAVGTVRHIIKPTPRDFVFIVMVAIETFEARSGVRATGGLEMA